MCVACAHVRMSVCMCVCLVSDIQNKNRNASMHDSHQFTRTHYLYTGAIWTLSASLAGCHPLHCNDCNIIFWFICNAFQKILFFMMQKYSKHSDFNVIITFYWVQFRYTIVLNRFTNFQSNIIFSCVYNFRMHNNNTLETPHCSITHSILPVSWT